MSNLREGTEALIKNRERFLQEARYARELLELLPEDIIALQGEVDYDKRGDAPSLSIRVYGKDSVNILQSNGVRELTYKASSPTYFSAEGGKLTLPNGIIAYFEAWNVEKPKGCTLEETTGKAYKIVCGEGIKDKV